MNLMKTLLATAIIAGATYLPQANASALGNIAVGSDQSLWGAFFGGNPAKGNFDLVYTFSIDNPSFSIYDLTGSTVTSSTSTASKSDTFAWFALENSVGTVLELGTVGFDSTGHATAYLPDSYLLGNGDYKLELKGHSTGKVANFGGSISISSVPEAEEWAMMLLGLPLVSLAVRRKQA